MCGNMMCGNGVSSNMMRVQQKGNDELQLSSSMMYSNVMSDNGVNGFCVSNMMRVQQK